MIPAAGNPWLLRPVQGGPPAATLGGNSTAPPPLAPPPRLSLLCFSPAGSGGGVFQGWQAELPPEVELLAVELPGRGARMKEPPLTSMQALVDALVPALLPVLRNRPFAFLGHSMGAWVAYQLTQELRRQGCPLPAKLYASANRAPTLAGVQHDVDATLMHTLPPANFWAAVERRYGPNPNLEHPSLRRMLLPMLQADFQLIETWRPEGAASSAELADDELARQAGVEGSQGAGVQGASDVARREGGEQAPGPPAAAAGAQEQQGQQSLVLPCPVAALGATQDTRYTRQQLQAWEQCAPPGAFEEHWFEGGHTYIASDCPGRQQLLMWLAADLERLLGLLSAANTRVAGSAGSGTACTDGGGSSSSGKNTDLDGRVEPDTAASEAGAAVDEAAAAAAAAVLAPSVPPKKKAAYLLEAPAELSINRSPAPPHRQPPAAHVRQAERPAPAEAHTPRPSACCWCW